jgi:hypothetical protein
MAYFPNGTAGQMYEEEYCDRCIHQDGKNGEGCPILELHLMHNYDKKMRPVLNTLIPMKGVHTQECNMFTPYGMYRRKKK